MQEAVKRRLASPNKQAATPQYVKITPSQRVASKNSVCGVANLDNGMTIVRDSRLAAIFFCWQRISRKKSDRLLGFDNAHDYHHRHCMEKIEAVEFVSFAATQERFQQEWLDIINKAKGGQP